jgi:hypothetical protein
VLHVNNFAPTVAAIVKGIKALGVGVPICGGQTFTANDLTPWAVCQSLLAIELQSLTRGRGQKSLPAGA